MCVCVVVVVVVAVVVVVVLCFLLSFFAFLRVYFSRMSMAVFIKARRATIAVKLDSFPVT